MSGNEVYLRYNLQLTLAWRGLQSVPRPTSPTIDRAGIQIINVVAMADVGPAKY